MKSKADEKRYAMSKKTMVERLAKMCEELYEEEISPIKLQKTLYFLFAYYIKEKAQLMNSYNTGEIERLDLPKYLFPANFEAWAYGPVDIDVYRDDYSNDIKDEDLSIYEMNFVDSFIEDYGKSIMAVKDFQLVRLSHEDSAWKNNYKDDESNKIPLVEIEEEYGN